MRKIKILTLVFSVVILFNSCGEFQRTIGKGTMEERYKLAVKLYEAKEFNKALRLFELVTPHYRGKPQMERIQFMVAMSNYKTKALKNNVVFVIRCYNTVLRIPQYLTNGRFCCSHPRRLLR